MSSTPKSKSTLKLKAKVAAPFSSLMAWSIIPSLQASTMTISRACHSKARLMGPSKRKRYQVQSMPKAPGGRGRPDVGRGGGRVGSTELPDPSSFEARRRGEHLRVTVRELDSQSRS